MNPSQAAPSRAVLARLGRLLYRRRRTAVVAALLVLVATAVLGAPTVGALGLARFEAPGSESDRSAQELAARFDTAAPNVVLVVTAASGSVDDPAMAEAGRALTAELAAFEGVGEAYSYWTRQESPAMRSADGASALIVAHLPGDVNTVRREVLPELTPAFTRDTGAYTVGVGGGEEASREITELSTADFVRAEMIVFPAVFVLLLVLLRHVRLALLPLGLAVLTMTATLAVLRPVTALVDVSTFALNLTLLMGLGLGVDYCLFVIARYREELRRGAQVAAAVETTVRTAGRTVLFSAATVAASLAVLLALPFAFLRSFAYAGIAVAVCAAAGALLVLPALLGMLGRGALGGLFAPRRHTRPPEAADGTSGVWARTAAAVMRRPVAAGTAAVVLLGVLGAPALGLRFGLPDDRILPEHAAARQVQDQIRAGFHAEEMDALHIVAPDTSATGPRQLADYARELSRVEGIAQVDSAAGTFRDGALHRAPTPADAERFTRQDAAWVSAVPELAGLEADPFGLVDRVRAVEAPAPVLVGGSPANLTDYRDSVVERLPLLLGVILALTFVILFLLSGSLLIPLKATVLNLLSLAAMFGALVWVFQEGNLAGLIGFTPTGTLESSIPILMFCIAYGLSMDYEVFMLARIKEEYDRTGDNTASVALGLQRSGPLISAAAAILAVSFAAYATSDVMYLQMMGLGLALAILVDATVIRAVLVPAFMRLAGRANWWAPAPLRRLHERFGISEADPAPAPPTGERVPAGAP
ncbi:MMPL family transporter [Allonocardiopsis opalescens]|uniref:RND superfamily putative drug exporter n=1 Tax=Allonocardiopsis opalescens TaxID=1144618 RepID=A0A2T0Q507_9ACTN|nr:MMPL family transporter [Allonocardiopsis opalescens]PRX98791.1 RND superfamily putative drug exporter [Allonocardiopsis opalescens]